MSIKKVIIWIITIVVTIIIAKQAWNYFDPTSASAKTNPQTTPVAEAPEPSHLHVKGWKYVGREIGLNWYRPEHTDRPTELVEIAGRNFDDGVETLCLMKLIKDNGETRTFKVEPKFGKKYLQKRDGQFEEEEWNIGEYTEFGLKSKYVQFLPLDEARFDVKVGLR